MIALQDQQAAKEKIISLSGWSVIVSIAFKNALDSSKKKKEGKMILVERSLISLNTAERIMEIWDVQASPQTDKTIR